MPSNNILDITIAANDGSNHVYITGNTSLNVMTLTLTNPSPGDDVSFNRYTNSGYSIGELPANNSAIYLLFNGLLSDTVVAGITFDAPGWTPLTAQDDRNGRYWVLLPSSNVSVQPGDSLDITIKFPAITGPANSGYFTCQYVNVNTAGNITSDGGQLYVMLVYPPRTDGAAVAMLPVQFETVGSNVVYNGGVVNNLTFRITNTSAEALVPGGTASWGSPGPQFKLYFIQDSNATPGSLMTDQQAGQMNYENLQLYQNKLKVEKQASTSPQVFLIEEDNSLTGRDGTILGTGISASVNFTITSIITGVNTESNTMAILEYSGFPGYQDGRLTTEIRVKNAVGDPEITMFTVSPQTINIRHISTNPVAIRYKVSNAASVSLYEDVNRIQYLQSPVTGTEYGTDRYINRTTAFLLSVTNAEGKTATRVITAQVDTVPIGTIAMWSDYYSNIPAGWTMCNGSNGTPDLRGRFVLGAQGDALSSSVTHYLRQAEGGAPHGHPVVTNPYSTHTDSENSHTHTMKFIGKKVDESGQGAQNFYYGDGLATTDGTSSHLHTITIPQLSGNAGLTVPDLPPFYALYFIMKIS